MSLPKVLRLPEVMLITSLSKSTVYAWMEAGSFPESKELGRNSVGWYEKDIQKWIEDLPNRPTTRS
jgi:prophage regulatory protein